MTLARAVLTLILGLLSATAIAGKPAPFEGLPPSGEVDLFAMHGSNTIGAHLGPTLVTAYLQAKGAQSVTTVAAGTENEQWVQGTYQNTLVRVRIEAHGSGTGFAGLKQGAAHIAAASRPVKDKEANLLQAMADMRSPQSEHIVGIDGLAIVVNPANSIAKLSVSQIADIFSGQYQDWSELGGPAGPIRVYARDDKSGTWDSFKSMVLGKQRQLVASAQRFESNDLLSDQVASDPFGIGFVALSAVRNSKLLAVSDGGAKSLLPNKLTVATEDYALSRRLYLYTDDQPENPYVQEFIDFALADDGQQIVAENGFVSQQLQAVVPEFYAELPRDFRDLTAGAKRLTINFRFRQGSAKLDNKALSDIDRLVAYLETMQDPEVILIGFSDQRRTEERSELLSRLRAMAVRRELVKRGGIYPRENVGYGMALPVASGNRDEGKLKNSRVEVWLRDQNTVAASHP
ncbi:hypothetical protein CHH28_12205 [Bacterioplanes sanyensis]|uniref:OmpA-like domain-containing protein n=1 Tax=Bacterioplanes sanyensis TaxID=1249553 RepID=A0A222FK27_9GAMM|nr:phosphate ABC transporter substrate-binding/OmpA family protein [Bacterioplanes sanyensis]ASP39387.1 hypothetical protein CHH28_12205 [Bacterioplanes sanyensis]